jgi:hypothetical protein
MNNLNQLLSIIHEVSHSNLFELSPLKIKTILFFSQIEYYTIHGEKLFDCEIRCYYNDIQIDGLEEFALEEVDETTEAYDMIQYFTALVEEMDEDTVLERLYLSKAFLRANLSRGHRLTKQLLEDYHRINAIYAKMSEEHHSQMMDEVNIHYEFVDEIIEDLEVLN